MSYGNTTGETTVGLHPPPGFVRGKLLRTGSDEVTNPAPFVTNKVRSTINGNTPLPLLTLREVAHLTSGRGGVGKPRRWDNAETEKYALNPARNGPGVYGHYE